MSIVTLFESWMHTGEADLATAEAAFSTADKFVGVLMGEAEQASAVLAAVDPAIGVPINDALGAVVALHASIKTAVGKGAAVSSQIAQLTAKAIEASVQVAPFIHVVANDIATATAAVRAQAAAMPSAA